MCEKVNKAERATETNIGIGKNRQADRQRTRGKNRKTLKKIKSKTENLLAIRRIVRFPNE